MKLYRYLFAYFGQELKQSWHSRTMKVNGVSVSIGNPDAGSDGCKYWLITASVNLATLPCVDEATRILVPKKEREECETSALHAINLISVFESCSKEIFSPLSCVAFGSDNPREREFLENSHGIFIPKMKSDSTVRWKIEWTPELATAIADRLDGVALLSEAFSGGNDGHQYRDFIRFFELAFGRSFYGENLGKKLRQFLSSRPGGYDSDEINGWVNLRHPSIHADKKKTSWIATSADLRHVVLRMHQACLDVLFNKEKWHDPSQNRRHVWRPDAITTSKTGNFEVTQGTVLPFQHRLFDAFGVYPVLYGERVDFSQNDLFSTYWKPDQPIG